MAQKCAHKGCGKVFTDPNEVCVYHPGPPEFHEGQKGWKCCKPRVLTFDEFLAIPPCTTGKHSIVDENAVPATKPNEPAADEPRLKPISTSSTTVPIRSAAPAPSAADSIPMAPPPKSTTPNPELEEDSDDPDSPVPENTTCKRRSCGKSSKDSPRDEDCTFHPGVPIFHEGSKGWTCCKRRVLEFDEFMKIGGCKTRRGHCFIGKRSKSKATAGGNDEELLEDVRNDYYQTPNTLIVSFYLKKIDKQAAKVEFLSDGSGIDLDLVTGDTPRKRFKKRVDTWKELVPEKCKSRILGTKLEMELFKQEGGVGWPMLAKGGKETGERIQVGKALRA